MRLTILITLISLVWQPVLAGPCQTKTLSQQGSQGSDFFLEVTAQRCTTAGVALVSFDPRPIQKPAKVVPVEFKKAQPGESLPEDIKEIIEQEQKGSQQTETVYLQ